MAMPASLSPPITEVDITALLQPRQGYLWKLGGGQETGSKCASFDPVVNHGLPLLSGLTFTGGIGGGLCCAITC